MNTTQLCLVQKVQTIPLQKWHDDTKQSLYCCTVMSEEQNMDRLTG